MLGLTMRAQRAFVRKRDSVTVGTDKTWLCLVDAAPMGVKGVARSKGLGASRARVACVQMVALHVVAQVGLRGGGVAADAATPLQAAAGDAPFLRHFGHRRVHHRICKCGKYA
jgi:hypothetical protein